MEQLAALREMPTLTLAYVGDAVFETMVRSALCRQGLTRTLHKETVRRVRAGAQAVFAARLLPELSEEEKAVLLRGRNTEVGTIPKSASREEYQWATGLETLWGYLYLDHRRERLAELFALILEP